MHPLGRARSASNSSARSSLFRSPTNRPTTPLAPTPMHSQFVSKRAGPTPFDSLNEQYDEDIKSMTPESPDSSIQDDFTQKMTSSSTQAPSSKPTSNSTMEENILLLLNKFSSMSEQFDSVTRRMDKLESFRDKEIQNIKINHGTVKRESDDFMEDMDTRVDSMQQAYFKQQETIDLLTKTNEDLLSTVTKQNLKLNATDKIPSDYSRYSLAFNPDAARYPLLKSTEPKHSFGKFQTYLTGIELESDSLASLEIFWNTINSTLMMVLQSNQLFPDYKDLDTTFSPQDILIPPHGDPNHATIVNAYVCFSKILRNFLLSASTIKQEKAPNAYKFLISERL